jgi:hypothetical protein
VLFAPQLRSKSEASEPDPIGHSVYQNVDRFNIFVNQASLMQLPQCTGQICSQAQEPAYFDRLAKQAIKPRSRGAGILKHKLYLSPLTSQRHRSDRPVRVKLVS